jgi:ATP-dependent DNA ligase
LGMLNYNEGFPVFFQTTTGKEISDIPCAYEYEVLFKKLNIKNALIAGELVARIGGKIPPFNETQSIVKMNYVESNKDLIYHYPYDIYSLNGRRFPFAETMGFLHKYIGSVGLQHVNLTKYAYGGPDAFRDLFNEVKGKSGFDGIVVRKGNKNYKVKFTDTVDLAVIGGGHEDMKAWSKGEISYLLTAFVDKDGLYRTSSKVGTGYTRDQRIKLFKYINENTLYKEKGEFFVKPKVVAEVKYFRSRVTPTPTLKFVNNRYEASGTNTSVTLSMPSFVRLRDDKIVNKYDTRLEQIPEFKY